MAKITYENKEALNQNSSIPDKNKVNDTDMNMIKNVVNDNETKILLAVSSSAPATCDTGDIYFNTTDNLIYTATATNTWGATGVEPTENTIYIEFTNQTLYAYDGTTLVSVGGGAGGGETLPVGSEIDFDGSVSDIPDGWEQVDNVLWTNSNPNNNFSAQTIPLNLSNYNYVEIIYYTEVEAGAWKYEMTTGKLPIINGNNVLLGGYIMITTANQAPQYFGRQVVISTTGIEFKTGQNYNGTQFSDRNASGVPIKIIVYK